MNLLAIALLFATSATYANDDDRGGRSFLRIDLNIYGNVSVEIDGIAYTSYNGFIDVRGLAPGQHQVVILQNTINHRGYGRVQVLYRDCLFVPANSRLQAVVRQNGRFDVVKIGKKAQNQKNAYRSNINHNGYDKGHQNTNNKGRGRGR